jgi:hypothetical protein
VVSNSGPLVEARSAVTGSVFTSRFGTLPYFDAEYNHTRQNERAVELAIAHAWLRDVSAGQGVEIGCVTPHYWPELEHTVVDLFEQHPRAHNIDLFDVEPGWDWVLSISTVEHVGQDFGPKDESGAERAIKHLESLTSGPRLIMFPLGYNRPLDAALRAGEFDCDYTSVFMRDGDQWAESGPVSRLKFPPYGTGGTIWANALAVLEWE